MKKILAVLSLLAVTGTAYAQEVNVDLIEDSTEEMQVEDQALFLQSIQEELENTKKELEKYKTEAEKTTAKLNSIKPKWNHELYFGVEQEINSNEDWKYIDGTVVTSPYTGMYLYQDGSKFMYDIQFLKTYISTAEEYNRNRFSAGVTYRDSFKLESGKTGTWGVRVGYRNDSYHWDSINKESLSLSTYKGYLRKGEERNEIWFRPTATLNLNPKVRLTGSLSFRGIDRELDYARFNGEYSVRTRDWSSIQEHMVGMRYTFANRNFASLDYLFVREDLKRTLLNTEHFAIARYFHFLPNKDTVSPYVRIALGEGEQVYYNGLKQEIRTDKVTRPRVGIQYRHIFTPQTNVMFDAYYRPQNIESNGKTRHENFFLWTLELTHKF